MAIIGVLVFSIFNFRPKGKAKCFAGDVGSVGIGFIMLFAIGRLIMKTGDVTWLVLLLVYGVAVGGEPGIYLSVPEYRTGALGVSCGDRNRVGNRLHFVYAEVLSFARGVSSWVKG